MVQPVPDPYAADQALAQWAQARGYTLSPSPEPRWYGGWYPCIFLPMFTRLGRELRASFGEASVALAEAFEADPIKQATGEDRSILVFLGSPRLTQRVAVRSKSGGGLVREISSGFGALFNSGSPGGVLGDPTFEARYEVTAPSREEGNLALPVTLRRMLLQHNWQGILETRNGGMVATFYERRWFEPTVLDGLLSTLGQIYQAAVAGPG